MHPATRPEGSRLDMARLGGRIRRERGVRGLSLATLALRAGVSRSMLSAMERGVKAPTILVLDRVATGLGTSIARLVGEEPSARVVVLRRHEQDVERDRSEAQRGFGAPQDLGDPLLPGAPMHFGIDVVGSDQRNFLHGFDLPVYREFDQAVMASVLCDRISTIKNGSLNACCPNSWRSQVAVMSASK